MPFLNARAVAHGTAGVGAYYTPWNGTTIRIDDGGGACWFNDHIVAYRHDGGGSWVALYDIGTGEYFRAVMDPASPFYGKGADVLRAGGNVWASFQNGVGVFSNAYEPIPLGYLYDVGPSGAMAYKPVYQSGGGCKIRLPGGGTRHITDGPADEVSLVDATFTVVRVGEVLHVYALDALRTDTKYLPGAKWRPHGVMVGGRLWLSYFCAGRIVIHPEDETVGYEVPHSTAWHDVEALGTKLYITWAHSEGEADGLFDMEIDTATAPRIELNAAPPIIIPPVNKPLYLAWYEFSVPNPPPPRNCTLNIYELGKMRKLDGTYFARWVAGQTVEEIEANVRTDAMPAIAYWDGEVWPRWPVLPSSAWTSVRAYCKRDLSLVDFERNVRQQLDACPSSRICLTCQQHTDNIGYTSDIKSLIPIFARLMLHPKVTMVHAFHNTGRANSGLAGHPELRPYWQQIVDSISIPIEVVMPAPNFTIDVFDGAQKISFPTEKFAPAMLRGVYVNTGGGEPDWIEWQYSTSGPSGAWVTAVRNPGDDKDHTYRNFDHEGTYWIRARAGNASGEHQTGAERKVVVRVSVPNNPHPPDPIPPQPQPKPPSTTERVYLKREDHYAYVDENKILRGDATKRTAFTIEKVGNKVAVKAAQYVAGEPPDGVLKADRETASHTSGSWELHEQVPSTKVPGRVGFRANGTGKFWRLRGDGTLQADSAILDMEESFELEPATGARESGPLSVSGKRVVTIEGSVWFGVGVTWFPGVQHWIQDRGRAETFMDRAVSRGVQWLRVICMYNGGIGRLIPWEIPNFTSHLRSLVDAAADRGQRVQVVVNADCQNAPLRFDPSFFDDCSAAVQGTWNVIMSGGNEMPFNGFDAGRLNKPAGLLSTRCSMGTDATPYSPPWDLAAFETSRESGFERSYKSVWDLYNGQTSPPPTRFDVPVLIDEMIGIGETNEPGRTTNDPFACWQLAGGSKLMGAAGICAHIRSGILGDFPSPGSLAEQCVDAMVAAGQLPLGRHAFGEYQRGLSPGEGQNPKLPIIHNDREGFDEHAGSLRTHALIEGNEAEVIAPGPGPAYRPQPKDGWRIKEGFAFSGHEPNILICER